MDNNVSNNVQFLAVFFLHKTSTCHQEPWGFSLSFSDSQSDGTRWLAVYESPRKMGSYSVFC